jgi:hypothetical protein
MSPAGIVAHVGTTLRLLGKCVTAGGTANGSKVLLARCNASLAQQWVARSDGTLLNRAANRCLNVPLGVTTPQTQLEIYACTTARGERWTLPG